MVRCLRDLPSSGSEPEDDGDLDGGQAAPLTFEDIFGDESTADNSKGGVECSVEVVDTAGNVEDAGVAGNIRDDPIECVKGSVDVKEQISKPANLPKQAWHHKSPLEVAIGRYFSAMGLECMDRLLANMEVLAGMPRLRLGTGCSGSDIVVKVFEVLWRYISFHHGISVPLIDHQFSAEQIGFKQEWITAHYKPRFLFKDWLEFSSPEGVASELYSDGPVDIPRIDIGVVGIECDSVSSHNHKSSQNRDSVNSGEGKTGATAKATLDWIERTRPFVCIMENVRNLHAKSEDKTSNLDKIITRLNACGYVVRAMLLDAPLYGCPARRQRWYIVVVRVSSEAVKGVDRDPPFLADLQKIAESMQIDQLPLADFLLDESHEVLMEKVALDEQAASQAELLRANKKAKLSKKDEKAPIVSSWEQEHMEAFGSGGFSWPPDLSGLPPHTVVMGRRKQELIWLADKLCKDNEVRIEDINMSIYFSSPGADIVPCIVSTCNMWMTDKKRNVRRELHGMELMALQGWHISEQKPSEPMKHEQLRDLAGNAFCSFQLAPVIIALLTVVDWSGLAKNVLASETVTGIVEAAVVEDDDKEVDEDMLGPEQDSYSESDSDSD